jgi:hypothetical protein
MDRHEFICIPINLIPDEIVSEYRLHNLVNGKGFFLTRIEKGMHGLPQAGMLARNNWGPMVTVSCTWSRDLGQSCNADVDVPPVHLGGFGSFLLRDASPVLLPQSFIA